ncbi:hypothetical protein C8Q72DRAFT_795110 [Fomitopsis betulina]|nr:hypothetical protein C8Q72DRAFT_795110 [Fomitopsis betulina]
MDPHLGDTIGCFFAGTIFATLLYGCTCGQGLYYLSEYPDDRRVTKALLIWDYVVRGHQKTAGLATMPSIGSIHHLFAVRFKQVYLRAAPPSASFRWAIVMRARWSRWILVGVLGVSSLATYSKRLKIVQAVLTSRLVCMIQQSKVYTP